MVYIVYCSLITLPASAFDGRQKFLDAIRISCKDSTINLGGFVSGSTIAEYAAHLKDSYWSLFSEGEDAGRDFFVATHMGHQAEGYWILSEDVSFEFDAMIMLLSIAVKV